MYIVDAETSLFSYRLALDVESSLTKSSRTYLTLCAHATPSSLESLTYFVAALWLHLLISPVELIRFPYVDGLSVCLHAVWTSTFV